jgi:glycogen synthase
MEQRLTCCRETNTHLATAAAPAPEPRGLRLRTLQIGDRWSIENGGGGGGRVFVLLATHLAMQNIAFSGVVAGPPDLETTTNGLVRSFSPLEAGSFGRCLGARRTVSAILNSGGVDLVASHFAMYASPAIDKIMRLPHVVHFHGPWAAESLEEGSSHIAAGVKYHLEKAVYKRAQRVIVLSRAFADLACRDYGIDENKIAIVPGAVERGVFESKVTRTNARNLLGWPRDEFILLAVRRLSRRMGLNRLIGAMKIIKEIQPDVILYIVGQGAERGALERRVADLNLDQHVRFTGFLAGADLPLAYRAADINVVPSRALEGFGLVAAEALAAGTPSMVTPVGGLPEVVSLLSPSLIFRSSETPDIADGLLQAISGALALPGEEECRRYAMENFSGELMAERTARVYRESVRGP